MADLTDVLWIGGVPGAGKSAVARRLAHRHGLRRYNPDTRTWAHLERALAEGIPAAQRFAAMTPAQRGAATREQTSYDRGPMLLADLRALPRAPLIVAEGTPPAGADVPAGQSVSLVLSEGEQRARLERRHPEGVPPRYRRMWHDEQARVEDGDAFVVHGDGATLAATLAMVERHFRSRLAAGPTAVGRDARRALLRAANRAALEQSRGWLRHTPSADASAVVVTCECECADRECVEAETLALAEATAVLAGDAPLVVSGHHR